MLTRNVTRIVNKINNASPTAQCTAASCKDMLVAMLNAKVYELAESTVTRLRLNTSRRWFILRVAKADDELGKKLSRYGIKYPETLDVPKPSRLLVTIGGIPKRTPISEIEDIANSDNKVDVYLNPEMLLLEYS